MGPIEETAAFLHWLLDWGLEPLEALLLVIVTVILTGTWLWWTHDTWNQGITKMIVTFFMATWFFVLSFLGLPYFVLCIILHWCFFSYVAIALLILFSFFLLPLWAKDS